MTYNSLKSMITKYGPKYFFAKHINDMDKIVKIQFLYDNKPDRMKGKEVLLKSGVNPRAIEMITQGIAYVYRYKIQVNKY